MKPIGFSWPIFLILLAITAVLGSLSSINRDNIPDFGASVVNGLRQHDVLLLLAAVLSAVLLAWLLLVFITRVFGRKSFNDQVGS